MAPLSKDWTADELLREARRRERRAASTDRALAAAGGPARDTGRAADLRDVPTGDLVAAAKNQQRVIYGPDDRQDIYQVTKSAVRKSADAVVALVKADDVTANGDGSVTLATESYRAAFDLCGNEPFVSQPVGCFCSGFLVAPDVVATAGHCVKDAADLAGMRFVFGFRMTDASTARTQFPAEDVYTGIALLGRQLADDGTDWALVRLDRAVSGRRPVAFRTSGKIKNGQPVYVIGHPCGLPQKFAPGAKVRDNQPAPFFVANLDTFGGNSGSPVFNAATHTVEGILVRGETDFVSNGQCSVSLVCPSTGCRGEDVTRATVWSAKVPKAPRARVRARRTNVDSRRRRASTK